MSAARARCSIFAAVFGKRFLNRRASRAISSPSVCCSRLFIMIAAMGALTARRAEQASSIRVLVTVAVRQIRSTVSHAFAIIVVGSACPDVSLTGGMSIIMT